jgi:hypothetical protein
VEQATAVSSVLSFLPGFLALWLGVPFVVAGSGLALGLSGLGGNHRQRAIAAVVVGALFLALGAGLYLVAAVDKLS